MRVLIAEDNGPKVSRLIDLLVTQCVIPRSDIDVAGTIMDARGFLRSHQYDLFILDIVLPLRPEDEPTKKGATELLDEISTREGFHRPTRIIGLTAYDDAIREVGPLFAIRVWTVIKFEFESDEWKNQIRNCVMYMQAQLAERPRLSYRNDLCIVTALPVLEMDAILRMGWNWSAAEPIDDSTFVRRAIFESQQTEYRAITAVAPRMGMVASALLAARLIERERPRYLVVAGICAGVQGKTNYGDIILGHPSWDWQSGKYIDDGEKPRFAIAPDQLLVPGFVRARAEQLRADAGKWGELRQKWQDHPETELKLRIGPMASGSSVLADESWVDSIVEQHRNLLAVEMEAYGVYAAAATACSPRPTAFALKAVSDFANGEKNDRWQGYAAYTSANAVRIFFETYMHELVELAGTG